jgi:SAM-dependent methyltransferase
MSTEVIRSTDDLLTMLDSLMPDPAPFWNGFYSDRTKKVPFFVKFPDENLVSYFESGILGKGKMLELGCGPGRNAIYAALKGYEVDALDISEEAVAWAKERAREHNAAVHFECRSVFDLHPKDEYDFVYDAGCLHHLWPHRRIGYMDMIHNALKAGGCFGLTCFAPGYTELGGAEEISDWEVYREKSMKGGQAYSKEKLFGLLGGRFEAIEFRPMIACAEADEKFGMPFLWASLWRKK